MPWRSRLPASGRSSIALACCPSRTGQISFSTLSKPRCIRWGWRLTPWRPPGRRANVSCLGRYPTSPATIANTATPTAPHSNHRTRSCSSASMRIGQRLPRRRWPRDASRPSDVADHIRSTAVPGELILLKGSGSMHLERIALSWVEDVQCWVPACGRSDGCLVCGLYRTPFDDHKGRKNWKRRRIVSSLLQPWLMLRRNSETRPE